MVAKLERCEGALTTSACAKKQRHVIISAAVQHRKVLAYDFFRSVSCPQMTISILERLAVLENGREMEVFLPRHRAVRDGLQCLLQAFPFLLVAR